MDRADFPEHITSIVPVIREGNPLTRAYLLKKMPKPLYQHPLVINEVYKNYPSFDLNSKTLLIKNLEYSTPTAVLFLAEQLSSLSENQLKSFLSAIDKMQVVATIKDQLSAFSEDQSAPYHYIVKDFLEDEE